MKKVELLKDWTPDARPPRTYKSGSVVDVSDTKAQQLVAAKTGRIVADNVRSRVGQTGVLETKCIPSQPPTPVPSAPEVETLKKA